MERAMLLGDNLEQPASEIGVHSFDSLPNRKIKMIIEFLPNQPQRSGDRPKAVVEHDVSTTVIRH